VTAKLLKMPKTPAENFAKIREVGACFQEAEEVVEVMESPEGDKQSKQKLRILKACEKLDLSLYA